MGTDIHGVVQARYGEGRKWWTEGEIPDSRNYTLFAALAGVRNGYGFAGVYRHEPLIPISEPRGFPEDVELIDGDSIKGWTWCEAKNGYHSIWLGDHSHTWLTIEEILDWDGWDKNLVQGGVVSREQYEAWDHDGPPEGGWSGMISGPEVINAVEGEHEPEGWTHIHVSWSRPLRESCESFLAWCKYAETLGEQVRIVIGFDS